MEESTGSLTDTALNILRDQIQNCVFMPGQHINEKEICELTGLGRTPVREALQALQREGSIQIFPRRGIQVTPFTYRSVDEIYQVRKLLEPTVCSQYYLRMDKETLLDFDSQFRCGPQYSDREYFGLDVGFHKWLMASCENSRVIEFYNDIMHAQYRFSMYTSKLGTVVRRDYYDEHHRIIEALLTENPQSIQSALTSHIRYSQSIALQTMQKINTL